MYGVSGRGYPGGRGKPILAPPIRLGKPRGCGRLLLLVFAVRLTVLLGMCLTRWASTLGFNFRIEENEGVCGFRHCI